jgi:zinc transporter ZupT
MCELNKRLFAQKRFIAVAMLPVMFAALIPSLHFLPISNDARAALMGFFIGISIVALAVSVRAQRC